ncbi:hypothetical protein WDV85_16535 [Pseudokineococcus sp. 5B2Z-1]|uniref:hypothetical protein n=1 Tax=Pseudokineococcus sp. 5B2Z-1 TaxID=3132744 RepID=UPI003098DA1D
MSASTPEVADALAPLWTSGVMQVWLIFLSFPIAMGLAAAFAVSRTPVLYREVAARAWFPYILLFVVLALLVGGIYTAQAIAAGALPLPGDAP